MGNSVMKCACCDEKQYRLPLVFDQFNIIERIPMRTLVQKLRYSRKQDDEDQRSSQSEKEK